jgi:putative ABC transport system permease protein
MLKIAVREVLAHKRRLVSMLVAIVLGVGFMSGIYVLSDTVKRTFDDLFASVYRDVDVVVEPRSLLGTEGSGGGGFGPRRLPGSVVGQLAEVEGVASASGFVRGAAQPLDGRGRLVGGTNSFAFGIGWIDEAKANPFNIVAGRAPAADDEIALGRTTFRLGKFALGDQVRIQSRNPTKTYTLVGEMRFGSADSPAGAHVTAFTPAEADRVFSTDGQVNDVFLVAETGITAEQLKANVTAAADGFDARLEVLTGAEIAAKEASEFRDQLENFTKFLAAFSLLALVIGGFVIFNTFSIIITQRRRELALLRAVGAERRQVTVAVLVEAVVIAVTGSLLGLAAGIGLAWLVRAGFDLAGIQIPAQSLVLAPRTVSLALGAGMLVTVGAAVYPAIRASQVPPVEAMREAAFEARRLSSLRLVAGALVLAVAIAVLVWGLSYDGVGDTGVIRVMASFVLVMILMLPLVGPNLVRPFARSAGKPLDGRGMSGHLARQNAMRSPRRTALTSYALAVGLALVGLIAVFASSFNALIDTAIDGQLKGDYVIQADGVRGISPEIARQIRTVEGVQASTAFRLGRVQYEDEEGRDNPFLVAFDPQVVDQLVEIPMAEGRISDVGDDEIAVDKVEAEANGWKIGDKIPVTFRDTGRQELRLAALIDASRFRAFTQGAGRIVSLDTYGRNVTDVFDFQVYVKAAPGTDLDALYDRLAGVIEPYGAATLTDQVGFRQTVRDQIDPFVYFIYGLLFISILIAGVGVANTMKLSVSERTRELGLLRAVGMVRGQARTMVRWESVLISVFGALVGMLAGVAYGIALLRVLRRQGFTELVVPYGQLVVFLLGAFVLGVVAAWGAARRAARLDVLRAIATE